MSNEKKCDVKVLIGNKIIRYEKVNASLVPEYISSFRKFYREDARFEVS